MVHNGVATAYTYTQPGTVNPHAPTLIGSTTLTYDPLGNLRTAASSTYTYSYDNRLTTLQNGLSTTTYSYDTTGARVQKVTPTITTTYVSSAYDTTGTTTTTHIYSGDTLIASYTTTGTTTTSTFVHPDHLGSTNVTTSGQGFLTNYYTYTPYGSHHVATTTASSTYTEPNQFIGQDYDPESTLSYLNARYYDSGRGQFLGQDPVFWEINQTPDGKTVLQNPQAQNSYSYAGNNPMVYKDASGRATYRWNNGVGMSGIDTQDTNTYYEYSDQAMLYANAGYMAALSGNPIKDIVFSIKSWKGAEWDYNNKDRKYYFFEGELVDKETFGNRHYGFVGAAAGNSDRKLKVAGGIVQIVTGHSNRKWGSTYFDQPHDTANIQKGIDAYSKSPLNSRNNYNSKSINSTIRSLNRASDAISRGDYASASKHLQKATNSAKKI